MKALIEEGKRLTGKKPGTKVESVLHPGGRGERGFVTFFLYDQGKAFCLAKVPRVDNALSQTEADNLAAVGEALANSTLRERVDRALGTTEIGGKLVLFKQPHGGRPSSQLVRSEKSEDVLTALRATSDWLFQFIQDTTSQHVFDPEAKREAAEAIASPDGDCSWVETFVNSQHQFLGPAHGDLVPANVLLDQGAVSAVVDFENYQSVGLPYADFVGVIVSVATTAFGRGDAMLDTAFRTDTWFSAEVAKQASRYCSQVGCTIKEFVGLLPLYSDRSLSISKRWGMHDEHRFHQTLRDYFVSHQDALTKRLS